MREKLYSKHGILVTLAVMLLTLFGGNVNAQTVKSIVMQNEGGTDKVDLLAESVEKLIADYNIVVTLEDDANVNYLILKLGEGDTYMKTWSSVAKGDDGKFSFWIPTNYELALGVDYPVIITGYETNPDVAGNVPSNFTSTDLVIKGGTKQYEYSSVTLVDPDPNTIVSWESQFALADPSQKTISFTYSGPVQNVKATIPKGMGIGTVDCGVALSDDEKTVTVTIPESILSTYHHFTLNVYAYGKDNGGAVKGNSGEKEVSAYQVNVDVDYNLPKANISWPTESTTTCAVSTLKFAYANGILEGYNGEEITVKDGDGNVVATSLQIMNVIPFTEKQNYNYLVNEVAVSLNEAITTPGTYTVTVPKGLFNLDQSADGFTSKPCQAATYTFTIVAPSTEVPANVTVTSDPAQGPIDALDGFTFTFNGVENVAWTNAFAPVISWSDNWGNESTYDLSFYTQGQGSNLLRAALLTEGSFTDPGNYYIIIPAGAVYFNNDESNVNTEPFFFKYEIEAPVVQTYTVDPAEGVVESLKKISVIFDGQDMIGWGNGNPVITDADGNEYKVDCSYGTAYNEGVITLKEEITTPGTYTLTIPAGAVVYGEYGDSSNEEDITFTWTIEAPKAEFDVTPANGSTVESLSNITVTFNKISADSGVDFDWTKQPTFTLPSGEVVNLTSLNISYGSPYNLMMVNLWNEYTATGIYKLFLPAGFVFEYGNESNVVDKDLTFEWGIGVSTEIQAIFANEKNVEVYDASGVRVKSGDASVIKSLAPNKMYIINGKKFIIKK